MYQAVLASLILIGIEFIEVDGAMLGLNLASKSWENNSHIALSLYMATIAFKHKTNCI